MDAWFDAFVAKNNARSHLPSAEEYVATHDFPAPIVPRQDILRDDVRADGSYAGPRFVIPGGDIQAVDIFGDVTQHRHAAATFASLAQRRSGFSVTAPNIEEAFQKYLDDFIQVHWTVLRSQKHAVEHNKQNHAKFLTDLVEIVTDTMASLHSNVNSINTIVDSIQNLSRRVALSSNSVETNTLYVANTVANEDNDVFFTIFFVTMEMRHSSSFKSEVLSTRATTYSLLLGLNSGIVRQFADIFNRLTKSSVEDFVDSHTFPEPKVVTKSKA